ncbi:G1/S-specific cyclin-E2-like isoform X2 [Myripristis murdjan]|uniref:Cyclin E2 n=2 Tax=Myripristis murdjan TaxID=586833 RepID=A0A667XQU8_9TELE|nr:G1/S-specific cyclin-E2-like isoform X2 [Myripristis murdjan]XP_029919822.1 G1/S-specific cyclin-E2-like isoform X2 [Myripristis murdjan]XP_029919823.1 G1/S-specific cyclin-E2-like isoform X2 [Myripristis murdjan]
MTRRSSHLHKRSENALIQKGKITRQSNRRKAQPLSKLQCEKNQLVLEGVARPCVLIETPEKGIGEICDEPSHVTLTSREVVVQPTPLPALSWGCSEDVWVKMVGKEQKYTHSKSFLQQHPRIQPRMRSILLDWLVEVSEVYTLHRQTFYLAQDYFDRFMLTQDDVDKGSLQLIGITCLFIASKMEEIYPPKLAELAYVTDGACFEDQILQMELIILKALNWNLCPETPVSWLKLYIQMASMSDNSDLLEPQFSQDVYVQITQLLDLCILSINSLDFQYRVLAASVLCHFLHYETVQKVSGLSWDVLQPCVDWMAPFVETVARFDRALLKDFVKVKPEDRHNIQTHADYIMLLDEVSHREMESQLLTPPSSTEKTLTH